MISMQSRPNEAHAVYALAVTGCQSIRRHLEIHRRLPYQLNNLVSSLGCRSEEASAFLQVHHQWPEADASLAKAEAALKMVPRIVNERRGPAVLQEAFDYHMTIPSHSTALHDVVKWLKEDPAEAKVSRRVPL